ncbi:MBL fold metallo-hydrolase [Exiguobacterium aestuarii]|uniref:MBL fold metallo-hydrolase n=1 Tax=Exiguobacterium aestuarii TaxID=273527 RepID=UPI001CD557B2|nr:MBL fold metallo-hydrolase [Exiguobacterium aestuarii]MCA0981248.1 MBL fold metallo-hydrolase [Exiguobacterium aestuarii]
MNIQLIRNATLRLEYAGKTFLIDPFLAKKGTYPPFPNSARQDENNPLVELPISIENLLHGIDAVILTHLHLDHYDEVAKEVLPKELPIFVQNEADQTTIQQDGFTDVRVLTESTEFEGIHLVKTVGEHGRGDILSLTGQVCGVVFTHETEKTLYVVGDTVWYEGVAETIQSHRPEVIVVNAGDNQFLEGGSLVMNEVDVLHVAEAAPEARIIAVHMEAVNHWNLSRTDLRAYAEEHQFADRLFVPEDGESLSL